MRAPPAAGAARARAAKQIIHTQMTPFQYRAETERASEREQEGHTKEGRDACLSLTCSLPLCVCVRVCIPIYVCARVSV